MSGPFAEIPESRRRALGRWIVVWSVMVVLTLIIGGITRLTESGLSITEWAPVSGVLPPLSDAAWGEMFLQYQQIPEFQLRPDMTLDEFKFIFFWEWFHRIWGRLIGLALIVPAVVFWWRGWMNRSLLWRTGILAVLTGAQGALGWYMVSSGLVDRTDVSQYRLAAHLGLALVIYAIGVWTSAQLLVQRRIADRTRLAGWIDGLIAAVFLTAVAGAFVAGIDGGRAYNSFPLMGGRFVPSGYGQLAPWWANLFENVAAVQFNHRWLGMMTFGLALGVWWKARAVLAEFWEVMALPWVAGTQVALGITTLLLVVPVGVASLHQVGAVALLTFGLLLRYRLTVSTAGTS